MAKAKLTMTLPTNPEDRKIIKDRVVEVAEALVRKQSEQDLIKEIKKGMKGDYSLSPKLITKLAKAYNDQNYTSVAEEAQAEAEEFEEAASILFKQE